MTIKFKMSLLGEIKEWIDLLKNRGKIPWRSTAFYPNFANMFSIIPFYLNKREIIEDIELIWQENAEKIEKFWKKANLKELGEVICFIHLFGYNGWFDSGKNYIFIRYDKTWKIEDLAGTLLHELIHLATHKPWMVYEEWEAEVAKYADLAKKITGLEID